VSTDSSSLDLYCQAQRAWARNYFQSRTESKAAQHELAPLYSGLIDDIEVMLFEHDTARAVRALESLKLLIVNLCRQYGALDDKAHLYLTRTMELQREKTDFVRLQAADGDEPELQSASEKVLSSLDEFFLLSITHLDSD